MRSTMAVIITSRLFRYTFGLYRDNSNNQVLVALLSTRSTDV